MKPAKADLYALVLDYTTSCLKPMPRSFGSIKSPTAFGLFIYKYESFKMTVMTQLRRVGSESQRGGGSSHIIYSKQHYVVIFVRCVCPPIPSLFSKCNATMKPRFL